MTHQCTRRGIIECFEFLETVLDFEIEKVNRPFKSPVETTAFVVSEQYLRLAQVLGELFEFC